MMLTIALGLTSVVANMMSNFFTAKSQREFVELCTLGEESPGEGVSPFKAWL